jgi:hypothetical protein
MAEKAKEIAKITGTKLDYALNDVTLPPETGRVRMGTYRDKKQRVEITPSDLSKLQDEITIKTELSTVHLYVPESGYLTIDIESKIVEDVCGIISEGQAKEIEKLGYTISKKEVSEITKKSSAVTRE